MFKVGDRVVLVDAPWWTTHREYIGMITTIAALPGTTRIGQWRSDPTQYYVEIPGATAMNGEICNLFGVREASLRKIDDGDPFAEPRDIGDDTPNKVVKWEQVPYFKPRVTVE